MSAIYVKKMITITVENMLMHTRELNIQSIEDILNHTDTIYSQLNYEF